MNRWRIRTMAIATAIAAFAAPGSSSAQGEFAPSEYCNGEGDPGGGNPGGWNQIGADLCAHGPAGCVAVGLYVIVEPTLISSVGGSTMLSRSATNAGAWNGYGYGTADTAVARASVPPAFGTGALETRCDSFSYSQEWWADNHASGRALANRLAIDLGVYGLPVYLNIDTLQEDGWSHNGSGVNTGTISTITGQVFGTPVSIPLTAAPNTAIGFGPATLYLNEQTFAPGHCPVFQGNALRLVVTDPTTGLPTATVIVSSVSTSTCP